MNDNVKEILLEELIKITNKRLRKSILPRSTIQAELMLEKTQGGMRDSKEILNGYLRSKGIAGASEYFANIEKELVIEDFHFSSNKELSKKVAMAFSIYFDKVCLNRTDNEYSQRRNSIEKIVKETSDYLIDVVYPYCSERATYRKNFPPLKPSQYRKNNLSI